MSSNPFAIASTLPYQLPPFEQIKDDHYLPAFYEAVAEHKAEIEAIKASGEADGDDEEADEAACSATCSAVTERKAAIASPVGRRLASSVRPWKRIRKSAQSEADIK